MGSALAVESAERREKRASVSTLTEASVPTASAAGARPERMTSTASWMAVAPEAHAVETVVGGARIPASSHREPATQPWSREPPSRSRSARLAARIAA